MKKFAIIVLALVALSFGCDVGDSRWCTQPLADSYNNTATFFGGPEYTIRKMLKDPCEGTKVDMFILATMESGDTLRFELLCKETGVWIYIYNDSLVVHELRSDHDIGSVTGDKARRAFHLAESVAKEITSMANNYNWNP